MNEKKELNEQTLNEVAGGILPNPGDVMRKAGDIVIASGERVGLVGEGILTDGLKRVVPEDPEKDKKIILNG